MLSIQRRNFYAFTVNGSLPLIALGLGTVIAASTLQAEPPLLKDFIGLNVHTIRFKPDLYRPITHLVRDYHPVHWDLAEETDKLPDFPNSKNGVDWDQLYRSWKGFDIDVCLMFESIEREKWKDISHDAEAYGKTFAREFGPSGKRPLVNTVEIGNEPGKWSDADFSTLFRAMATGVRKGDPKLKIATCNLTTGPSSDYEKSVTCIQDMLDLVDILCIHTYPMLAYYPTWKRSYPEDPKLLDYFQIVENLIKWRDEHAPAKPIYITEFGYDSSTQKPASDGNFSQWEDVTDEQHAVWLVRSILLFAAFPVERAYIYYFDDDDEPQFHASSGLTRRGVPKQAYFAVANLQNTLGDYRFQKDLVIEPGRLRVQEYQHGSDPRLAAWAVWSPTGEGKTLEWTLENTPGTLIGQERLSLEKIERQKHPVNGKVLSVTVTEEPLFLFFQKP